MDRVDVLIRSQKLGTHSFSLVGGEKSNLVASSGIESFPDRKDEEKLSLRASEYF